jgi:hypothetical protein
VLDGQRAGQIRGRYEAAGNEHGTEQGTGSPLDRQGEVEVTRVHHALLDEQVPEPPPVGGKLCPHIGDYRHEQAWR